DGGRTGRYHHGRGRVLGYGEAGRQAEQVWETGLEADERDGVLGPRVKLDDLKRPHATGSRNLRQVFTVVRDRDLVPASRASLRLCFVCFERANKPGRRLGAGNELDEQRARAGNDVGDLREARGRDLAA